MPRAANQKEKVLYVMKILLQETDEAHPLSTEEIIEKLSEAGVKAERKSIYSDMETLRAFGLDVHGTKGRSAGYYVGERDLHVPSENQPSASPDVRGMRFGTWRNSNPEPQFAQPKPGDDATLLRVVTCIAS